MNRSPAGSSSQEFPNLLHAGFEHRARSTPDAVALVVGDERLTYGELDARANRLARHLHGLAVGAGDRVGLSARRGAHLYAGLLGILKSGASYVPLDPDLPAERSAFILRDARCRALVSAGTDTSALPGDKIDLLADADLIAAHPAAAPSRSATPDDEAYVIYTSGTTGVPKGVPIRHRQVADRIAAMRGIYGLGPADRVLQFGSLSFDASIEEIFTAFSSGAVLVARPEAWSITSILALLDREQVTIADFTPSVWSTLTLALVDAGTAFPATLTRVILGGERLDPAKVALWFEHCDIPLFNCYGPTEAVITATFHRLEHAEDPVPIGEPVPGMRAEVVDETGTPAGPGESGELWLGGPGIADGYLDRPELTADRFVTGPGGIRYYRTGDRVRRTPAGPLEFLGRLDDQVKIGGIRIEPDEAAATLAAHPDLAAAHVALRTVQGQDSLVAYVVPGDYRQIPSVRQLRSFLAAKLPAALVPGYFAVLERMPLLPSGKLDRAALAEIDIAPRRFLDAGHVAPRPGRETQLAALWAEELGVERVGAEDDLMSLGAHSLRSMRVAVQIARLAGVDLSVAELLHAPTVRAQAALIEQREGGPRRFPAIEPCDVVRVPMSVQQKQLWYMAGLDADDMSYRFQAVIRVSGVLDLDILDQVLTELHRRHPVLRTTYSEDVEGYWQQTHVPAPVAAQRIDLRGRPGSERRAAADAHIQQAVDAPLDLTRLPLQRWTVVQTADEQFDVVLLEHHIVHDGWSFGLIMREFSALYDAFLAGEPSPLPEPARTYGDYAAWQQRELAAQGALTAQLVPWRERLSALGDPVSIVPDFARSADVGHAGAVVRVSLPGSLPDRMRAFCRERRITLFEMMSSAFHVFLAQHTRQSDLCIGSWFANRRLPDTQDVVGMFVNTVLLRAHVRPEESFEDLVRQVHDDVTAAGDLQEVPFPEIVRALNPDRTSVANPFAQVMFSAHDSAFPELAIGGADGTISYPSNSSAKFDLSVIVLPDGEAYTGRREVVDQRITMTWEYNSGLFAASTAERMAGRYVDLLHQLLADPARPFSELALVGAAEQAELAVLGRGPVPSAVPAPTRVVDHLRTWTRVAPEMVAVQDDHGRISYGELDDLSTAAARMLVSQGLRPQSVVGVFVQRGRDLPIAAAAAHKARLAYAPIDPAEPAERLATMLDGVDFVLCSEATIDRIPPGDKRAVTVAEACRLGSGLTTPLPTDAAEEDLAYIIYTSGSTGTPKGVMIEQGGLAAHIRWSTANLPLPRGSLIPCTASQSFDVSVWEMWRVLAAGATCLLTSVRLTPEEVVRLLATHRVTHCYLPTPLAMHLLTHHHDAVPDLVWLGAGGDRLELPVGTRLPFDLTNLYGPAEATIWATAHTIPAGTVIGEDLAIPPIGRPLDGTEVVVVDTVGRPVPIGVPGELLIGGRCVGRGYHRSPERTAERFVTRPGLGGGLVRHYRTGDLARWNPNGELEFLGRLDRQVKVRGYRIELSEIEAALRAKTSVADCAVIAERRQRSGVADMELVAFVVQAAGQELDVRSLRAALKDRLPAYMIPAVFVSVEQIPLTVNGKVDVAALARGTRQRLRVQEEQTVAPRDEIERAIADIWALALGVETVGVQDNFFDLGGHSLMVTQLINRIESAMGVRLSIREVYEAPTVAEMKAALVEKVAAEQAAVPVGAGS